MTGSIRTTNPEAFTANFPSSSFEWPNFFFSKSSLTKDFTTRTSLDFPELLHLLYQAFLDFFKKRKTPADNIINTDCKYRDAMAIIEPVPR